MYDTIVIGAGNAGIEAACAAARIGAKVMLITFNKKNIGELSCNPSIGGVAKGTIVREIDALDGIMGKCADMSGTYFKVLNASKGAAVHSPRCQIDRDLYKKAVFKAIFKDSFILNMLFHCSFYGLIQIRRPIFKIRQHVEFLRCIFQFLLEFRSRFNHSNPFILHFLNKSSI